MKICKLRPKTPLHLGEKETIIEETSIYVHSDTLFAALCNNYRKLYGKGALEKLLDGFSSSKPFKISSAFPYAGDILLFPLPASIEFPHTEEYKKLKTVEFVSQKCFEKFCEAKKLEPEWKIIQDKVLVSKDEAEKLKERFKAERIEEIQIWKIKSTPRVVLDRSTSSSEIYHFGEVIYHQACGLYFFFKIEEGYEEKLKASINFLSDEGLGGDRSCGRGLFFPPKFDSISLDLPPSEHYVTLSLFYPKKDEIPKLSGSYRFEKRGGWIYSPKGKSMRRKTLRMFKEGSVFKGKRNGKLKDVTPLGFNKYKVYRYGYPFLLPIRQRHK